MTITEMFEQSAVLTLLGMTIVFLFLWIMIICVNIAGKVIHHLGLDKDITQAQSEPGRNISGPVTPETAAAISAALVEYRRNQES